MMVGDLLRFSQPFQYESETQPTQKPISMISLSIYYPSTSVGIYLNTFLPNYIPSFPFSWNILNWLLWFYLYIKKTAARIDLI